MPCMEPFYPSRYIASIKLVFNYSSSGLLIYAALVDLLAEDFLSEEGQQMSTKQKTWGFVFILLGGKSPPFNFYFYVLVFVV